MKARRCPSRLLAAVALGVSTVAASVSEVDVTPVQKVLQMLNGMLKRAGEEKHQEQVQWAAYKQWCDGVTAEKQLSVKQADSQIDLLQASILSHDTEADRLEGEIQGHAAQVVEWTNQSQVATSQRSVEREDYVTKHRDYSESLAALDQAIRVLKQQDKKTPGTAALLEKVQWKGRLPKDAERLITAFLSQGIEEPDLTFVAAPLPNAYEFQSKDIVNLLEELKDKFKSELRDLEAEETTKRHAFDMLSQDLTDQTKAANKAKNSKTKSQAKHRQASAADSSQLTDTQASRAADFKDLQDITATCKEKSTAFENRQDMRTQEITALQKAIDIIGGGAVAGHADTYLPSMVQRPSTQAARHGALLVQLRASAQNPNQLRAAAYLREMSERIGSRTLSTIAVQARDDPFTKVKKLIQELVDRLMAESTAEAEHKGWCDTELGTNEQTRTTKSHEVETLRAEIDGLQASISQLGKDLATLSKEIAEINASVAKATELRNAEKVQNAQTLEDAREAQTSVSQAIKVLQDFYTKAADAESLLQHGAENSKQPPIFDAAYKGQQGQSGGVIAMLEVIQSDFARLEKSTEAAEASAESDYNQFTQDSEVAKVQKETDVSHKKNDKQSKEMTLVEKQTDLENAGKQLAAAQAYFEKLKPSCLDAGQSYEERVARRKDEIEALQQALKILSGEDIAALMQQ